MTLRSADAAFESTLSGQLTDTVLTRSEPRYLEEPRGTFTGRETLVARPGTTEDVASIVRLAAEHRVPVMPYGGGTGLVGGQISPDGPLPLILSLERMNRVRAVHPEENVMICEAGVILADVQKTAAEAGRLFPLSLAAEGTARIGGNLATNAGGTAVLRYGNTRDLCLGLEAVLPDGQIWHGLRRLRKDNTGYDLRHLLIGSEGTLGVITAASLKLFPQPAGTGTAIFVTDSPATALSLLALARSRLGDLVTAFELISGQAFAFLAAELPQVRQPLGDAPAWSVLIEIGTVEGMSPDEALAELFEAGLDAGLVSDGVIAQNAREADDFWAVRENIPIANKAVGAIVSSDVSLPLSAIPSFIDAGVSRIAAMGDFRINCFGHLGDGNLHYNIFPMPGRTKKEHLNQRADLQRAIHDLVHEFDGSFSAEHGVGRLKVADLERYGDPAKLGAMRAIKAALDPLGIMNPGAVLRT
ncbi:FAD-binding oxidoreductase [Roseobacter sp. S98]|uniref:FAD-binding oxidoreductase n=1 Tax=Roseobacter algicola (ex Choi et al. 2025) (nom. illeg.) TaxID=3092138 RepID=UPI003F51377E